jgi:hypothetical protein
MKNFLFTIVALVMFGISVKSQTTTPTPTTAPVPKTSPEEFKKVEFDKKFRFGLRVTAQPTWFTSNENNNPPFGAKFGTGFGLNMELKLSEVAAINFGVGGDFEGGSNTYKNDPANQYQVRYWQNSGGEFIAPTSKSDLEKGGNTGYLLKERSIKTTIVTLPAILKLSTSEYGGFKYFGMFGAEVGIRIKTIATDKYYESTTYGVSGPTVNSSPADQTNINLSSDASLIPMRIGLNVGLGTEYRLGGSTSAFISVNYFRSFTNLLKNQSKFLIYNTDSSSGTDKFSFVKQNLILNAIRINLGILF